MNSKQNAKQVCADLVQKFYDKFEVYPVIRHRRDPKGIWYFTLEKIPTVIRGSRYYKMGETISMAQWYIHNLKNIPVGTITFDTLKEAQEFKRQQKEDRIRKNNEILI